MGKYASLAIIFAVLSAPAVAQTVLPPSPVANGTSSRAFARWLAPEAVRNIRLAIKNKSGNLREIIEQSAEDARRLREEFRASIEAKRLGAQGLLVVAREEFEKKIGLIKDDRRRQLTARIREALQHVRENRVERFSENIYRIDEALGRVKSRMNKAAANEFDISGAEGAVNAADAAVAHARLMIAALTERTYTIAVSGDATLKVDVSAARDALRADITAAYDAMRAAQEAVRAALGALLEIPGIDGAQVPELPPASTSSVPTTTP
jgi:hypothetical protein